MSGIDPWVQRIREAGRQAEDLLGRHAPWLLLLTAAVYYAFYYRHGLNLGGEGGSNAVLALRLMEGQRPIADTFLGYNLMWFYPLVALFTLTGPDYVAMRVFFFVICAINGLLGYAVVRQVTRQAWLATTVAVILILVPGMLFRNYMGLIGVLSMLLLLKAYVLPAPTAGRQAAWMTAAGAGLTLCFLLRIEPSLLLLVVWLGLAVLYPLGPRADFLPRLRTTLLGTLLAAVVLIGVHGLFAWHAEQRGFGPEFRQQYTNFVGLFRYELAREIEKLKPAPPAPAPAAGRSTPAAAPSAAPAPSAVQEGREARLARPALGDIWKAERERDRYFGLCLYFPVFWSSAFVAVAAVMLLAAVCRGDDANKRRALVVLTTTGCSLVLFPQYFYFRPDPPHLSEFMIPFLPAVACSAFVMHEAARHAGRRFWRRAVWVLLAPSILLFPVYLKAIMPRDSAGTIVKYGTVVEFTALNGVRVKVRPEEAAQLGLMRDAILQHSEPGEYVICYPYSPTINFMTDRPSYEYNLYIDDSTADSRFESEAAARIDEKRPAVIVIDNRPVNQTEQSRFRNWAGQLTAHIEANYRRVGVYPVGRREIYVYARPDKAGGAPGPGAR